MKIIELHFKNLNSLQGEWKINFLHPEYQGTGLFAITGPTGSGKTTILDAICLALYGRTPRISSVITEEFGPKTNIILSKGTTSCFSEIVFYSKGGKYRASWTSNLAHYSIVGKPQDAKRRFEIFDPNNQKWHGIADKSTDVDREVPKVIGLNYDQFTRSVMLAQGEFAAFLGSKPQVKAQSLEQITGTAIYSKISNRVYRKNEEIKTKLAELKANKDSTFHNLITPEDRLEKEQLEKTLLEEKKTLEEDCQNFQFAINWYQKYQEHLQRTESLKGEKRALDEQSSTYQEIQLKVNKANQAREIAPLHSALEITKNKVFEKKDQLKKLSESETKVKEDSDKLEQSKTGVKERQRQHEIQEQELAKTIAEVTPLDISIKKLGEDCQTLEQRLESEEQMLRSSQEAFSKAQQNLANYTSDISKKDAWLKENIQDEKLVPFRDDLVSLQAKWSNTSDALQVAKSKLEVATEKKGIEEQKLNEAQADEKVLQGKVTTLADKIKGIKTQINKELKGESLENLVDQRGQLNEKRNLIQSAEERVERFAKDQKEIESCKKRIADEKGIVNTQNNLATKSQQLINDLEEKIKRAENAIQIATLSDRRASLKPGEPCPLCGALDHPYCTEELEDKETAQEEKNKFQLQKKKEEEEKQEALGKVNAAQAIITAEEERLPKLEQTRDEDKSKCLELSSKLGLAWSEDCDAFKAQLLDSKNAISTTESDLHSRIQEVKKLNEELSKKDKEKTQLDGDLIDAQHDTGLLISAVNAQEAIVKAADQDKKEKEEAYQTLMTDIRSDWGSYHSTTLQEKEISTFLDELLNRAKDYAAKQEEIQLLNSSLGEKENHVKTLELAANDQLKRRDEAKNQFETEKAKWEEARKKRIELFGDKNCAVEEKKLNDAGQKLEEELKSIESKIKEVEQEISNIQGQKSSLETLLKIDVKDKEKEEADWQKSLQEKGFVSEEEWKKSNLESEEVKELENSLRKYQSARRDVDVKIDENARIIAGEEKQIREDDRLKELRTGGIEDLLAKLDIAQSLKDGKGNDWVNLTFLLQKDKNQQKDYADLVEREKKLAVEAIGWGNLNKLIGSEGGSNYRNFVQGLIFGTLLDKANASLQELTRRYSIRRSSSSALEIEVVDHYFLNGERTVKTLSGGESFLVSLALALGLADMAGQNVQIDSLFLDEGFGTLDDENLDKVIGLLGNLHSTGKLIGIISHVDKIKEAIFPQINVERISDGVSVLKGYGVSRIIKK